MLKNSIQRTGICICKVQRGMFRLLLKQVIIQGSKCLASTCDFNFTIHVNGIIQVTELGCNFIFTQLP